MHPDQSRNRLIFTGNGDKGVATPVSDWALEFADSLPSEILAAIREARGEIAGSIEDDEYRRRLQDRFGSRWSTKRLVSARPESPAVFDATITNELEATTTKGTVDFQPHEPGVVRPRKPAKTIHRIHSRATLEGPDRAIEAAAPVDVPRYRYRPKDEFEKDWHLAMWVPNDPEGPTVVLNQDAPILLEAIKFHQDQYPDVYAAEVMGIVHKAYGEIAVAKIAHSQKLRVSITEQELDLMYRSEQALTLALMGLLAEEAVISQRIKLGRKRAVA